MKKLSILLLFILSPLFWRGAGGEVTAQQVIRNKDGSYFKQCKHFEVSRPLRELAKEHPAVKKVGEHHEAKDAARKYPWKHPSTVPFSEDPIAQREQGTQSTSATLVNVDGTNSAGGYDPLDPNGMVGLNHYVQAVNSNYQIFDKTGTALTASIDLATLFPGSTDDGDPIVMYDKFADRWIVTEFQATNPPNGNENELLFAVSQTNDPTGAYYLYTFEPDAADYADYPKFSIWSDGYYETCNCDFQKVTVYERTKMLLGDATAGFIVIPSISNPNTSSSGGFFCPQTLYADGSLPPYGSPQYMFDFTDDNWGAGFTDMIHIYKVTADWITKTGTLAPHDSLIPQAFNSYFTGGTERDISQPGTSTKIDALDGFFSYRIPYMRWGTYNAAVMAHVVNTGSGTTRVGGVRWYELHQDTTTTKWSIYQQGTYSPSDGVSRWNPAIAMDANGSIGLAYSVSAPTTVYPGIRFTGRAKCDSSGKMTLTETTAIAGSSAWTSDNRWGDYSHTSVDPSDGVTFWHTNQYIGAGNALNTRIFSFKISPCSGASIESITGSASVNLTAYQSANQLNIKASNLPSNENSDISLYDLEGKLITSKAVHPALNTVETTLNVFSLAKGIYYLRIGNNSYQRVIKVPMQ
ncbi:MAG TPA: T9SS type A sorting domain-containing protein [Bacteroidia bacterium]